MIDALVRLGLRLAYGLLLLLYVLVRPRVRGALVTVWHGGEVLVLRNSYRRGWSLPGGGIRRGEQPREAARRELAEEIGLHVAAERLAQTLEVDLEWERKRDHVVLFELRLADRPAILIDHREVVEARFLLPAEALVLDLIPPARCAVQHAAETGRPGSG